MSSQPITKESPGQSANHPPAIIHKQILDAAKSSPNASLAALAEQVSGASKSLVERVLDEYGDPASGAENVEAAETSASGAENVKAAESSIQDTSPTLPKQHYETKSAEKAAVERPDVEATEESVPSYGELSDRQQEIIEAIYRHPEATQRELASILGITGATISVHVSSIPGLDWAQRKQTVTKMLKNANSELVSMQKSQSTDVANPKTDVLINRVEKLEEQLESEEDSIPIAIPLAHKIIHACIESDRIAENEEIEIIEKLLQR